MYRIFAYIYHKNQPNVGEYTIHGSYGVYYGLYMFVCTAGQGNMHCDMHQHVVLFLSPELPKLTGFATMLLRFFSRSYNIKMTLQSPQNAALSSLLET